MVTSMGESTPQSQIVYDALVAWKQVVSFSESFTVCDADGVVTLPADAIVVAVCAQASIDGASVRIFGKNYSPLVHMGKGLYQVTIELIEWQPPPPVSIVSTASTKKRDQDQGFGLVKAPEAPDPVVARLEHEISFYANQP
jgi:hypothetical protein